MANYVLGEGAARHLKTLFEERGASLGVKRRTNETRTPDIFAHPWEVRYAKSEGALLIWLPENILIVDGTPWSVDSQPEPVDADDSLYPEGWYKVGAVSTIQVYLTLEGPNAASNYYQVDLRAAGTAPDDKNIPLAEVTYNASTGKVEVRQLVVGSLVLNTSSGGGGSGSGGQGGGCDCESKWSHFYSWRSTVNSKLYSHASRLDSHASRLGHLESCCSAIGGHPSMIYYSKVEYPDPRMHNWSHITSASASEGFTIVDNGFSGYLNVVTWVTKLTFTQVMLRFSYGRCLGIVGRDWFVIQ